MGGKLLLIDGHAVANRAYYGVPLLSNADGTYTNAVHGFFMILFKAIRQSEPERIAAAFDLRDKTFRHEMYADYKGTRSRMPEELHQQIPIIQELLRSIEIPVYTKSGYEADDILGTLGKTAARAGEDVDILTGDRDLLQLCDDHLHILLYKTKKSGSEIEIYDPETVRDRYGADPDGYLQMKALMGDASDHIPGVPGIGEKTAAKIIQTYGTVEEAIAHADDVKPARAAEHLKVYADQARFSLTLSRIKTDVPLEETTVPAWHEENLGKEAWIRGLRKYELKQLLERYTIQPVKTGSADETLDGLTSRQGVDISTEEELRSYLNGAKEITIQLYPADSPVACGLKAGDHEPCVMILNDLLTEEGLARVLKPLAEDSEVSWTGHDIKQEIRWMLSHGFAPAQKAFDTMVAAYLLNPTKEAYLPEDLARAYLNLEITGEDQLLGTGVKRKAYDEIPEAELKAYAYAQLNAVAMLKEPLAQALESADLKTLYETIEQPLIEVLASMEHEGIRVDPDILKAEGDVLSDQIETLKETIYEEAGETFNLNSTKQLGHILFEKLGLPASKKTKTGYSTSVDVLEKLKGRYPIVEHILTYRKLSKLKSTYVDGLLPCIQEDGKIHCRFKQTVTATGRLSSADPNLQNIPIREEMGRQLRKAFLPKNDDYIFMDADYSQIELRLLAHMSSDEKLIEAYQNGEDIHTRTASQVLGIPPEWVTHEERSRAKAVSFGIIYGISAYSLSDDLKISQKEAADYIDRYFAQYPAVRGFLDGCVADAGEKGYGITIFGRKRPIDEIRASNYNVRSFGERVAKNMPIQGSAADIIKIAMIRVYERILREGLKSRLIIQVHDELLIEVYRPEEAQVRRILEEEMKHAAELKVPLEIDVHTGESWYEAK